MIWKCILTAFALAGVCGPAMGETPGVTSPTEISRALTPDQEIDRFVRWWTGSFSTEIQAASENRLAATGYPEAPRLRRDMRVTRLNAPAIGDRALFLMEVRSDAPTRGNRQRVMTFRWLPETREIQVEQLFFSTELAYDQPKLSVEAVEAMRRADFTFVTECDLYFTWDAERQRYKGGMRPRTCVYQHPTSGQVYAEFDMILSADALWYRDRSIRIPSGLVRGEIEGFSWLRFDRLADVPDLGGGDRISRSQMLARMGATARMEGVWEGVFRRYDAEGRLVETLPSRIEIAFMPDGAAHDYAQVNILRPTGRPEQRVESFGKWDVDRLRFSNARLEGYALDLTTDAAGLSSVFMMTYTDGSQRTVTEIVTLSPDGQRRSRATQYFRDGVLERRTLIDEVKVE